MIWKLPTLLYGQAIADGQQEGSHADVVNLLPCTVRIELRKLDGNVQWGWQSLRQESTIRAAEYAVRELA